VAPSGWAVRFVAKRCMATTNAERILLDTSLLVAASVEAHPANQRRGPTRPR
jgi:hypothetical protein